MVLTPLPRAQQAPVLVLVGASRLDVVPPDLARATSFLRRAEERLNQLPLLTSVVVGYGRRTTNVPGQHEADGRFPRAVFAKPPADRAATEKAEQVARTLTVG